MGRFPSRGRFIARADVAHAMLTVMAEAGTVKRGRRALADALHRPRPYGLGAFCRLPTG